MIKTIRERHRLTSVWKTMPDGSEWCIWDFEPGEYTENVSKAIYRAYILGRNFFRQQISNIKDK